MSALLLVVAAFLASAVEAVEALTIVLAVGVTRGWRSTMAGVAAALATLAAVVAVLGPALTALPISTPERCARSTAPAAIGALRRQSRRFAGYMSPRCSVLHDLVSV